MKRLWIAPVVVVLLWIALGCEKTVTEPEEEFQDTVLTGTWELTYSSGGNSAPQSYAPGNGYLLKFSATHYEGYMGGERRWRDTYTVVADPAAAEKTCRVLPAGTFGQAIVQGSSGYRQYFQIQGRQLTLLSGCVAADGGLSTYRKISEEVPQ